MEEADLKKRIDLLAKDSLEAYKAWRAAKQEAEKSGQKFDEPRPTPPKYNSTKVKGKTTADAILARLQRKRDEALQAKKAADEKSGKKEAGTGDLKDDGDGTKAGETVEVKERPAAGAKPEVVEAPAGPFYVLETVDCQGKEGVEVVNGPELSSRIVALAKAYQAALKEWEAAKTDAGSAANLTQPTQPKHKSTKCAARDEAVKLTEKLKKELAARRGQPEEPAAPPQPPDEAAARP